MPLFHIHENDKLKLIKATNFTIEKEIQRLIEKNLDVIFNCRFIVSEFPTGAEHAGRIDSLALSEDNNPVIIEYKKIESSELINQSFYYLSWIKDHKGDFQVIAEKSLGKNIEIDWSDIRVICIAPGYKKFDLHAVRMMGANIELWQYKLYENGVFSLDEIFKKNIANIESIENGKNPIMVAAGKKAAITRATGLYTFEEHIENINNDLKDIVLDLRDYILNLDESVDEAPKKYYIAYKVTQNFVCIEVRKSKIILYLKINPMVIKGSPKNVRDVRTIGHYGTGDLEYTITKTDEIEEAKKFIKMAYEEIG